MHLDGTPIIREKRQLMRYLMKKLGAKDLLNLKNPNILSTECFVSTKINHNWLGKMSELVKKGTRERQLDWYLKFLIDSDSKAVVDNRITLTRIIEHPEIKST